MSSTNNLKLTTVAPVYVVVDKATHRPLYMLLVVLVNGNYGAYKLPLVKYREDQEYKKSNEWPYRLRRSKNRFVIEILKDIDLMGGHIKIPKEWKSKYNFCHEDKTGLILDWLKFLNTNKKKRIG